jgi:rhodanese-related sulfurtransferase
MFGSMLGRQSSGRISPAEAKERLQSDGKVLLLDVRTPEEYRQAHIPGSVLLPLDRLRGGIAKAAKDKETEIIVYCLSGMRAAQACSELDSMGYVNVKNMGGIRSWRYGTESGS